MRFYTKPHKHYCGIDLHARTMFVCIQDAQGKTLLQHNIPTSPTEFRGIIAPFREDLVVSAECVFCWHWLADFCAAEGIPFVLGHVGRAVGTDQFLGRLGPALRHTGLSIRSDHRC